MSTPSLARLTRLYAMVREINKEVLRARNEASLFDQACRIAVEIGGFRFAWVGLVTPDGAHVVPVAHRGNDASFLTDVRIDLADNEYGRGPTGTTVRDGRPFVRNDLSAPLSPAPVPAADWRARAVARGYASAAAFPLRRGGRVLGALSVYADAPGVFDEEHVDVLGGLASDLSHALDLLDAQERQRDAEAAMRRSEERYRAVFQQAFESIFLIAPNASIVDANESACTLLGYTHDELCSIGAQNVVHSEDLANVPLRFSTIPRGGVIVSERRFVKKDGSFVHVELTTKALLDGNFQVVARDVTEKKQVQAQLLLADRMSSLGRLASGVAHEINNPLAYVMLNLEMLGHALRANESTLGAELHDRMNQSVTDAYEGAERMRRIVRSLSTFGRGDEERIGPVDVDSVLDSAVEIAAMQLRHRARLSRDYQAASPARANAFRLGQVFVNLLVNAADALRDDDADNEIILRTRSRPDGRVVVEVEDNGVGIPLQLQARIFDPFFTTKSIGRGTGLGLAVCHAIVTSFGGQITCESTPGHGTLFRVTLESASEEDIIAGGAREPMASNDSAELRGRVLVVDDELLVAQALAAVLDGHDVAVATSGREAIALCETETFDCVLCDVMMPDLSGTDVYEALRAAGRGQERRVVFITGGAVTEAARAALARLDNRVLEKPVDMAVLRTMVGTVIAEARMAGDGPVHDYPAMVDARGS